MELKAQNLVTLSSLTQSPTRQNGNLKAKIQQVLGKIPGGQDWLELWDDLERSESPEASFVHQIDHLEMGLQSKVYSAQGFQGLEEFIDSARQGILDTQRAEILEGNS